MYRRSPYAAEMVAAEREYRVALSKLQKVEKVGKSDRGVGVKTDRAGRKSFVPIMELFCQ